MADPESPSALPASNLRRRGLASRATSFAEGASGSQRRNSMLSDSLSDARNSIRSSTDDLLFLRVANDSGDQASEESHWQSAPLALALLPAIAGVFFQDGSAFVTDVTLLVLAAIFLNWSVRLPWDWYRSAQAIQRESGYDTAIEDPVETQCGGADDAADSREGPQRQQHVRISTEAKAIKELQIHELVALFSCFIFPIIGTWLLHGVRGCLSRPSGSLISNYNLTIFLLASEIRPFAHLLKLVQARTLHLQRIVASSHSNSNEVDPERVQNLTKRLEELEAHVAEAAAARLPSSKEQQQASQPETSYDAPTLVTHAAVEARKALQPDIEALNRAVRRYEKRTALTTLQADTRFQHLEAQVHDAISLAAAAQTSTTTRRTSYAFTLVNWACACIVVPAQLALSMLCLPGHVASGCLQAGRRMLGGRRPAPQPRSRSGKGKAVQGSNKPRLRPQSPPPRMSAVSPLAQHSSSSATRGYSY